LFFYFQPCAHPHQLPRSIGIRAQMMMLMIMIVMMRIHVAALELRAIGF
jgi:hypothetical protein